MEQYIGATGSVAAFRSVKAGKNFFMFVVLIALLIQLGSFIAIQFGGLLDPIYAAAPAPTTQAASQPAGQTDALNAAANWQTWMTWLLPTAKFLAVVAMTLAVITFAFSIQLSIVGRLGGIAGFASAFFWSLILLAIITPWQQIIGGSIATGAICNFGDMIETMKKMNLNWGMADDDSLKQMLYFIRFIGYPLLGILIWLVAMARYARGFKDCIISPAGVIPTPTPMTRPQNDSIPME
jgi:hypothetical protein